MNCRFWFDFIFDIPENAGNKNAAHSEDKTKDPNDEKALAKILERDENINSQDSEGYAALHRAAKFGITTSFRTLGSKKTNQTNMFN